MNAQFSNKIAVGHRKVYNYRLNNPNSGCTVKEVQNGINALNNIKYIQKVTKIKENSVKHAFQWHIWSNNGLLINYIVASNMENEYKELLQKCKKDGDCFHQF